jgi:hypothetical protein
LLFGGRDSHLESSKLFGQGMARSRRKFTRPVARPWSDEEDERLFELCRLGASSDLWPTVFPDRRFGEVADRRLDLKPPLAPLL